MHTALLQVEKVLAMVVPAVLCSLVALPLHAEPGVFAVQKVAGQILHVAEQGDPAPVADGAKLAGGRLVFLDDASAQVTFPSGKTFDVHPNTVLFLDPKATSLENACEGAAAVRAGGVTILAPAPGRVVAPGARLQVLVKFDLEADAIADVEEAAVFLHQAQQAPVRLGDAFAIPEDGKQVLHLFSGSAPTQPGPWEIQVRSTALPPEKVGSTVAITVGPPPQ